MRPAIRAPLALLLAALTPAAAVSQEDTDALRAGDGVIVRGVVRDQTSGDFIEAAAITILEAGSNGAPADALWSGVTDESGMFTAGRMPVGQYELQAQALSYADIAQPIALVLSGRFQIRVEMVPRALTLEPIVVSSYSRSRMEVGGFYERREAGWGYTLDRSDIESLSPSRVSDIFVTVAGARVHRDPPGPSRVLLRNGCVPRVVLDGSAFAYPMRLDALVQPDEVEAIEIHHGSSAPTQFVDPACGTIMIWTRETAQLAGNPWSWSRAAMGVGIIGLMILAFQ